MFPTLSRASAPPPGSWAGWPSRPRSSTTRWRRPASPATCRRGVGPAEPVAVRAHGRRRGAGAGDRGGERASWPRGWATGFVQAYAGIDPRVGRCSRRRAGPGAEVMVAAGGGDGLPRVGGGWRADLPRGAGAGASSPSDGSTTPGLAARRAREVARDGAAAPGRGHRGPSGRRRRPAAGDAARAVDEARKSVAAAGAGVGPVDAAFSRIVLGRALARPATPPAAVAELEQAAADLRVLRRPPLPRRGRAGAAPARPPHLTAAARPAQPAATPWTALSGRELEVARLVRRPPHQPRDRGRPVPQPEDRRDPHAQHLPQARRVVAGRGGPGPGTDRSDLDRPALSGGGRAMSFGGMVRPMDMTLPEVVSRSEWLAARKAFLVREKEFTRQRDALVADRRRLPMVRVEKEYVFEGPTARPPSSTCSRAGASSSWATSCSTRAGTMAAQLLGRRHGDVGGPPRAPAGTRHVVHLRLPGAHRQDRGLQAAPGSGFAHRLPMRRRLPRVKRRAESSAGR